MTHTEREQLKENLRRTIAGSDEGIELDGEFRWKITGSDQSKAFFENLHLLLPQDAVLCFEGCTISRDIAALYETLEAHYKVAVMRDTAFPISELFHLKFSTEVTKKLCELVASRPRRELFDHIKVYREKILLLHYHDAFDKDSLLVADCLAESAVAEFSNSLGSNYCRELNINKRIESCQALLKFLESPHKIRIPGESWWQRLWRRLTWR